MATWIGFAWGLLAGGVLATLAMAWRRQRSHRGQASLGMGAASQPGPEYLALMAKRSPNAMVITDAARRITWVNDGFERITGYSAAEVMGRSPGAFLQFEGTDRQTIAQMREALNQGQPVQCELLNRSKSGRLFWVENSIQPLRDADGTLVGFMAIESDITQRKQVEEALRRNMALADRKGRIAGVGGWALDLGTMRIHLTDQACRMLECELGVEPTLQQALAYFTPTAQATLDQAVAQGYLGRKGWDFELQLVTARGRPIWVRLQAECEFDDSGPVRIVGAMHDICDRRELEDELKRGQELLRDAINAIAEAFVLYDPDDRLVLCNQKYVDLYHTSRDLIVPGARFEDIIRGGAERGQYPSAVGRNLDEWVAERMALHLKDDNVVVQHLDNGRVLRIVEHRMPSGHRAGTRVDITELVRATEAAERADRAKSEFIATISHELRTPLQAILGFSDLGRHFAAGHPQFEPMFQDIHGGGTRMLRLVNGLLDVSKIDGTLGEFNLKRADLATLAADVVRELQPLTTDRQLNLRWTLPPPALPSQVDAFRLQQVLRNVLSNAIRFAPVGSAIDLEGRHLGAAGVELTVRDHGPGIPAGELETVFDAFVQSSRTRNGAGGTGLGLTISRKIMHAHGGRITAESPTGGGALFRLWLPAGTALAQATSASPPPSKLDVAPAATISAKPAAASPIPATATSEP